MSALLGIMLLSALVRESAEANTIYPSWHGCNYHAASEAHYSGIITRTWDYQPCYFYQLAVRQEWQAADGWWWDEGWQWGAPYDNFVSWNTPAIVAVGYHRVYDYGYSPVVSTSAYR